MICPKCNSHNYQSSKQGYVCFDCKTHFVFTKKNNNITWEEFTDMQTIPKLEPMVLFCFNQQKMTEHRINERKFKLKTIPERWVCVECGCLNG